MVYVRAAIHTIEPVDSFDALRAEGVQVSAGDAVFIADRTVRVEGAEIRFRQSIIATGATPRLPEIPGLADVGALTSETIWDIDQLPRRLVILGGGPIGCEIGQSFARLGAGVRIVTRAASLLPREDPEAARLATEALQADGVEIHRRATGEYGGGRRRWGRGRLAPAGRR